MACRMPKSRTRRNRLGSTCAESSQRKAPRAQSGLYRLFSWLSSSGNAYYATASERIVLLRIERLDYNSDKVSKDLVATSHMVRFPTHSCGRGCLICKPSRRMPSYHWHEDHCRVWQHEQVTDVALVSIPDAADSTALAGHIRCTCGWKIEFAVMGMQLRWAPICP